MFVFGWLSSTPESHLLGSMNVGQSTRNHKAHLCRSVVFYTAVPGLPRLYVTDPLQPNTAVLNPPLIL